MKRFIALAAVAGLAACSQAAPEADTEAPATEAAAPAAAPTTLAADGKPTYGKFNVTFEDGTKITSDVMPDGTYKITDASGKVVEEGKWEQKSAAQYCETSNKDGAVQVCYDEKVDVKGVYTSYNPATKQTATVVRVEG